MHVLYCLWYLRNEQMASLLQEQNSRLVPDFQCWYRPENTIGITREIKDFGLSQTPTATTNLAITPYSSC